MIPSLLAIAKWGKFGALQHPARMMCGDELFEAAAPSRRHVFTHLRSKCTAQIVAQRQRFPEREEEGEPGLLMGCQKPKHSVGKRTWQLPLDFVDLVSCHRTD